MSQLHHRFDDLTTVVDEVHALFARLASADAHALDMDPFGLQVLKLAVHEWIANLVQHADFRNCTPEIMLSLLPEGRRVRCIIEDNSSGFDFGAQIEKQRTALATTTVPPERGRGLLIMIACTENLSYRRHASANVGGDGQPHFMHRLEFWVAPYESGDYGPVNLFFEDGRPPDTAADAFQTHEGDV